MVFCACRLCDAPFLLVRSMCCASRTALHQEGLIVSRRLYYDSEKPSESRHLPRSALDLAGSWRNS